MTEIESRILSAISELGLIIYTTLHAIKVDSTAFAVALVLLALFLLDLLNLRDWARKCRARYRKM